MHAYLSPAKQAPILFVDDDPQVLRALADSLAPHAEEFEVHTTVCPRKALEMVRQTHFAVVVADEDLGDDLPGHQFLKHLSLFSPHSERMMLSGLAEHHELKSLSLAQGVLQVMGKPWKHSELLTRLRSAVGLYSMKQTLHGKV
jgi:DNA-binding NtrC family response regulator